jgi:hypothetical protein
MSDPVIAGLLDSALAADPEQDERTAATNAREPSGRMYRAQRAIDNKSRPTIGIG